MKEKEIAYIKDILRNDKFYLTDKDMLSEHFHSLDEEKMWIVFEEILSKAIELKWSRRKLVALMYVFVEETNSSFLRDIILEYLDGLEGNCSWQNIVRLHGDLDDQIELAKYVRGNRWVYEDYFTALPE